MLGLHLYIHYIGHNVYNRHLVHAILGSYVSQIDANINSLLLQTLDLSVDLSAASAADDG